MVYFYFKVPEMSRMSLNFLQIKWHKQVEGEKKNELLVSILTCVAAIGGILFGLNTTVIAGVLLALDSVWYLTTMQAGLIVSSVLIGGLFGSIVSGQISSIFVRRYSLMMTTVIFIIGSIISGIATDYSTLIIGRIIVGFALGITGMVVPSPIFVHIDRKPQ